MSGNQSLQYPFCHCVPMISHRTEAADVRLAVRVLRRDGPEGPAALWELRLDHCIEIDLEKQYP